MADDSYVRWDMYNAAGSEVDADGFISVQADWYGEKQGGGAPAELHSPYGLFVRPLDPDADAQGNLGRACALWWGDEGGRALAHLGSDPRIIPLLPPIAKGESALYGSKGQFTRCNNDASISILTTVNGVPAGPTAGQTVYYRVASDGFVELAPWGRRTFDADGWRVVTASGARFVMGGMGGLPAPLSSLASYAKLSAASVEIIGSIIALGPADGIPEPIAKASATNITFSAIAPALTAIAAALTAIQAAVTAVPAGTTPAPTGGGPAALGAAITAALAEVTAAVATVSAAAAAVASAQISVPSLSTTVV